MKYCLVWWVFLLPGSVMSQDPLKGLEPTTLITLTEGDTVYNFRVIKQSIPHPRQANYYWLGEGRLHFTYGGYTGKVVHGIFEKFNRQHDLLEKGEFQYGLREGKWVSWYPNGKWRAISHWTEGERSGTFREFYSNGALKTTGRHVGDKLQGKVYSYSSEGKLVSKKRYRLGALRKDYLQSKEKEGKDTARVKAKGLSFLRFKKKKSQKQGEASPKRKSKEKKAAKKEGAESKQIPGVGSDQSQNPEKKKRSTRKKTKEPERATN